MPRLRLDVTQVTRLYVEFEAYERSGNESYCRRAIEAMKEGGLYDSNERRGAHFLSNYDVSFLLWLRDKFNATDADYETIDPAVTICELVVEVATDEEAVLIKLQL